MRAAFLDHQIPCMAFALEEKFHVNVWKSGLEELGLPTGPWLRDLKSTVARGEPDGTRSRCAGARTARSRRAIVSLGELKEKVLRIVPGQKIAYVTDAGIHPGERRGDRRTSPATLTGCSSRRPSRTRRSNGRPRNTTSRRGRRDGWPGRRERKRLVPFHFSPKHSEEGDRLVSEAMAGVRGKDGE